MPVGIAGFGTTTMTRLYSQHPPPNAEAACTGLECILVDVLPFFWIGLFAVTLVALTYLPQAIDQCGEEKRRTAAELNAFTQFGTQVEKIESSTPYPVAGPPSTGRHHTPVDTRLETLQKAYKQTVMAVPHYREEYDDSLEVSVAEEFDTQTATALVSGTQLTPALKRALLYHTERAQTDRRQLLRFLTREKDALETTANTLRSIETTVAAVREYPLPEYSFEELAELWDQLRHCTKQISHLLRNRCTNIHTAAKRVTGFSDPWSLHTYLYHPLECRHPILAETAHLLESVLAAEHRVVQSMATRI